MENTITLLDKNTMKKEKSSFFLTIVGGSIPVVILLSNYYAISIEVIIIFITIASLIFGSMIMWNNANAHAMGDEWWQDDRCSGWRGY